jgi:hypothetical protein
MLERIGGLNVRGALRSLYESTVSFWCKVGILRLANPLNLRTLIESLPKVPIPSRFQAVRISSAP